jgi:hypothetical protein
MFQSNLANNLRRLALLSVFLFIALQAVIAQSLLERIKALPDIISVEKMEQNPFFSEAYVVNVRQPIDHLNPSKGNFPQRVFVSHLSYDNPVVFITEGYGGGYAAGKRYLDELCPLLKANQIFVEHRFFGFHQLDAFNGRKCCCRSASCC